MGTYTVGMRCSSGAFAAQALSPLALKLGFSLYLVWM
jgi:hypothetical protein